eukprot:1710341-Amphidinium_carterae.1
MPTKDREHTRGSLAGTDSKPEPQEHSTSLLAKSSSKRQTYIRRNKNKEKIVHQGIFPETEFPK